MKTKKAYLESISVNAFHPSNDINGEIVGLVWVTPQGYDERLCYKVDYLDRYDYVAVSDVQEGLYRIVSTIT